MSIVCPAGTLELDIKRNAPTDVTFELPIPNLSTAPLKQIQMFFLFASSLFLLFLLVLQSWIVADVASHADMSPACLSATTSPYHLSPAVE